MQTYVANSEAHPVIGFLPDGYGSLKDAMTHCVTLEESRRSVLNMVRNYFDPKA
jgi:hypothetical protein